MSLSGIVWLASYPKSGNTWLRVFLANYLSSASEPVQINDLGTGQIASSRELFDGFTGVEASELSEEEIERLRPRVYEQLAALLRADGDFQLHKVHDAFSPAADRPTMFSAGTRTLYVIRNPLDVAVSFAHFMVRSLDGTIRMMARERATLAGKTDGLPRQLRQTLRSWSSHVRSWVDESDVPVKVLRYEDMKARPFEAFGRALRFLDMEPDPDKVRQAVRFSSFEELKNQERAHGFREGGPSGLFFRRGEVGSWKEELSAEQVQRIVADHRETMIRFGYLTEAGRLPKSGGRLPDGLATVSLSERENIVAGSALE